MATANNEFFEALAALEKERGLPEDYLVEKIKAAIVIAVKKDYEVEDDNVVVDIDPEIGAFRASLLAKQVLSQLSYTPAFSRFGFRCPLCFEGFVYGINPQDPQN